MRLVCSCLLLEPVRYSLLFLLVKKLMLKLFFFSARFGRETTCRLPLNQTRLIGVTRPRTARTTPWGASSRRHRWGCLSTPRHAVCRKPEGRSDLGRRTDGKAV